MIKELTIYLLGASGISTIIIFLGKYALNHLGKIGIEKYKSELREAELIRSHNYQISIESHKADLEKLNLEFQIKQSAFQQELLTIIRETFRLLIKFEHPLEYMFRPVKFNPNKTQDELANEVIDSINQFVSYTTENDFAYTDSISEIIHNIRSCVHKVWNTYTKKQWMGEHISGEMSVKLNEDMIKAYEDILQKELQELKKKLKKEFQSQLGIYESLGK